MTPHSISRVQADPKKIILKEQFEAYWESIVNKSINYFMWEVKLDHPASVAGVFEIELRKMKDEQSKKGSQTKYSPVFMALIDQHAESFVYGVSTGNMMYERLSKTEEDIISGVVVQDDFPSISKLFVTTLLGIVKGRSNNEGVKVIEQFLSYWGKILLIPQHEKILDNLSLFMKGHFQWFITGEEKLPGLTPEYIKELAIVLEEERVSFSA